MKHTLMVASTVAALVLGVAGVASADPGLNCTTNGANCQTDVGVQVTTGTTIKAPASVNVGSGFPGQTVTSPDATVSWWSNENPLQISVQMDGDLVNSQGTVATTDDTTIDASDVSVSSGDYTDPAAIDSTQPVADIADVTAATLETISSETFNLHVFIPSATEGTYNGSMTWSVE